MNIKMAPCAVCNWRNNNHNAFRTVVTWCVDDVDVGVFPHGVRGRRLDCDPALPLELHGIHDSSDSILTFHLRKKGKIKLRSVVLESLPRISHVQEWCFVYWATSFTQWRNADMAELLGILELQTSLIFFSAAAPATLTYFALLRIIPEKGHQKSGANSEAKNHTPFFTLIWLHQKKHTSSIVYLPWRW